MTKLAFADEMKGTCRHCATFARANAQLIYDRGMVPRPDDETATVTFIKFEGRTFASTALHVTKAFQVAAERDGLAPESYFLPAGRGVAIAPTLIAAPQDWPVPAPDVALCQIDDALPAYIGKEAFELRPDAKPIFPIPYAAAVGYPTAAKKDCVEPIGKRLAMQCVHAVAQGVGAPSSADQIQFLSEIDVAPEFGSLSGMSGGPVFWSDGEQLGLFGFVKEALDVQPRPGEDSICSGPRVNFIVQHAGYETFGRWVAYALVESPKRRAELNDMVTGKH